MITHDIETILRSFLTGDGYIAADDIPTICTIIEANLQRRDEPVGYVSPAAIKRLKAGGNAIVGEMKPGFDVPLYAAPQLAEPVGEVLGETCIDGGKCHHGCKERCFRRQCCEPFSDYSGPWKYAAETDYSQPTEPVKINAIFETEDGECIGKTEAKIKRIEYQDDGSFTVVIDYWPPAEPVSQHPDDAAVDAFAAVMKAKLAKKRSEGRGGWQECSAEYLSDLLRSHVEKGDPVDVANLAMMLSLNGQRITPAEPVKRKRRYAQGSALSEFGVIPMCDQVDDEPVTAERAREALAHEIWAAAQTAPGEGIEDAVERIAALLARYSQSTESVKVPSDADILDLWTGDPTHSRPVMGKNKVIAFARALLARYNQSTEPVEYQDRTRPM